MIEELMPITENKLKILKFIYENENSYLLKIARELKLHPFSLKRTVDVLIKKKIVEIQRIGKTTIYKINNSFYDYLGLLLEIEKYKLKTENKQLKKLFENINIGFSSDKNIITCILFGSYARNGETEKSDVDILFIVKNTKQKNSIMKKCSELSLILHLDISPVIMNKKEFSLTMHQKEPTTISLLMPSQRIIILGTEDFLRLIGQL